MGWRESARWLKGGVAVDPRWAYREVTRNLGCLTSGTAGRRQNAALFQLGPGGDFALGIDFHMDHIGSTADGTIFYVLLLVSLGYIDWDYHFFTA